MKQGHELRGPRIDPREIRTLMQVAPMACQRQILRIVGSVMLFRDDVLNVMGQSAMLLVQSAIFAALTSPPPDEVPRRSIHLLLENRIQMLTGFQLENRDEIFRIDEGFILQAFVIGQRALIRLLRKGIDPLLNEWRHLQVDHPPGGLSVEATAQRLQEAIQDHCSAHVSRYHEVPSGQTSETPRPRARRNHMLHTRAHADLVLASPETRISTL